MTIRTLFTTTALTLLTGTAAFAQESVTVNIGSSHPEANIWVYAMKNAFQPEVDRILAEKGEYKVDWNEAYGGTLYKFTDTRAAVSDGIVDVGMVGTVWEGAAMPLQNVTYFTPFATEDHKLLIKIFDDLSANLPALHDSWTAQNMVPLSSLITDSYDI
jgi:C4-dicarboxylate-binding protein DctP